VTLANFAVKDVLIAIRCTLLQAVAYSNSLWTEIGYEVSSVHAAISCCSCSCKLT